MARYRKVDPRIWNDAKFAALSNDAKLAFLFVLTHPHLTSLGAMRATVPGLAAELSWDVEVFREAFREALSKGIVEHDAKASCVWLPNYLKYNRPESPNVVKSWESALDLIPECNMKTELLQRVKDFTEGLGESFQKALPEAFRKTMPNQKQKQKQKLKAKRSPDGQKPKWTPGFDPGEFKSPERGLCRFGEAVDAGVVRPDDELRWLTLWVHCGRKGKTPAGLFMDRLKSERWDGDEIDEDRAREYLADVRRNGNSETLPEVAGLFPCEESTEVEHAERY